MGASTVIRVIAGLLVVAATAAAVVVGVRESGGGDVGRHVVMVAPSPGQEVQLGARVGIVAQGFDPDGVERWEVLAAGERIASRELGEDGATHVPIEATWVPTDVGPALIEVLVEGPDGRRRPPGRLTVAVVATTTTTGRRSTTTADGDTTTTASGATSTTAGSTSTDPTRPTTATTTPTSAPPQTTTTTTDPTTTTTTTTLADTTTPVVTATHSPARPSDQQQITFTITADDDRDLAVVELWVQPPGANEPSLLTTCSSSPCVHTAGPFRFGTLTYFGIARDAAGNEGRSRTGSVAVEQQPA